MSLNGSRHPGLWAAVLSQTAVLLLGLVVASPASASPASGRACVKKLDRSVGGEAAVRALGASLPAVARTVGQSAETLRRVLRTDPSLRVDTCARPFFAEPVVDGAQADATTDSSSTTDGTVVGTDVVPATDPFTLESRPGAPRTIHIDFTGHRLVDSIWNEPVPEKDIAAQPEIVAPPYDTDGYPDTYGEAERSVIASVWLRVSEDFAAFDVNVTTADPGAAALTRTDEADQSYGVRALVTPDQGLYDRCTCGGYAYLDVFDRIGDDKYQVALIHQQGAGAGAKNIGELVSHEVGHTLGLLHDGRVAEGTLPEEPYYSGHGAWAPIMGTGAKQPVSQWSSGTYARANNPQDDVEVMGLSGLIAAPDDHADLREAASPVVLEAVTSGAITTRSDHDWFAVTLSVATATSISVQPQTTGADVDLRLELWDTASMIAAEETPTVRVSRDSSTGQGVVYAATLPAGTYQVLVDGAGEAGSLLDEGYSDYASLGRYTLAVETVTPTTTSTATSSPTPTTSEPAPSPTPTTSEPAPSPTATTTEASPTPAPTASEPAPSPTAVEPAPTATAAPTPSPADPAPEVSLSGSLSATSTATIDPAVETAAAGAEQVGPAQAAPVEEPPPPPAAPAAIAPSAVPPSTTARPTPAYAGSLRSAVAALRVRREVRPALAAKTLTAWDMTTVASTSAIRRGAVPLAEAVSSGARSWSTARRTAFTHDRGDPRTLRAVTLRAAKVRGDRDPAQWLPVGGRCGYAAAWTAVKLRWSLSADRAEVSVLARIAKNCPATRIIVARP